MEPGTWVALGLVVVLVLGVDRLFRKSFRQRGDRTIGARQRGPQTEWKRSTGEVIDEMTADAEGHEERPEQR